jgi:hypothetical protein
MLTQLSFDNFLAGADPYFNVRAQLRLDDIPDLDPLSEVKLSVLMSTYHRHSQLQRCLECLARQTWKHFEVIICDDGDDLYDMKEIIAPFLSKLKIRPFRRERLRFHVDPTGGLKFILPHAEGEIIAIMQPELMLRPTACQILYDGHFVDLDAYRHYAICGNGNPNRRWVVLKTLFLMPDQMSVIDNYDWHSNLDVLNTIPGFNDVLAFGNRPNTIWAGTNGMPWWFCGSAPKSDPIWSDMPELLGHAAIDFWLMGYRNFHGFTDVYAFEPMAYHQEHHRLSIAPPGEDVLIDGSIKQSMGLPLSGSIDTSLHARINDALNKS